MIREIIEATGNKNQQDKKQAAKRSKAKGKIKCTGNKTPAVVKTPGNTVKYKCTTKDQSKSRTAKKTAKSNKQARKKGQKTAQKTKSFRAK